MPSSAMMNGPGGGHFPHSGSYLGDRVGAPVLDLHEHGIQGVARHCVAERRGVAAEGAHEHRQDVVRPIADAHVLLGEPVQPHLDVPRRDPYVRFSLTKRPRPRPHIAEDFAVQFPFSGNSPAGQEIARLLK